METRSTLLNRMLLRLEPSTNRVETLLTNHEKEPQP